MEIKMKESFSIKVEISLEIAAPGCSLRQGRLKWSNGESYWGWGYRHHDILADSPSSHTDGAPISHSRRSHVSLRLCALSKVSSLHRADPLLGLSVRGDKYHCPWAFRDRSSEKAEEHREGNIGIILTTYFVAYFYHLKYIIIYVDTPSPGDTGKWVTLQKKHLANIILTKWWKLISLVMSWGYHVALMGCDGNGTLPLCPASILKAHNPSLNMWKHQTNPDWGIFHRVLVQQYSELLRIWKSEKLSRPEVTGGNMTNKCYGVSHIASWSWWNLSQVWNLVNSNVLILTS